ncbi:MAG: hypothetical protein IH623_06145 [Verrucomicrobia bacterium]|nr:hypothetical protein [Verrucomicrobiota bacterium]
MKPSFFIVLVGGVALVAGAIVYLNHRQVPPQALIIEPAPSEMSASLESAPVAMEEPGRIGVPTADAPAQVAKPAPVSDAAKPESQPEPEPAPTPFTLAIATLVSPKASFHQKQDAWRELRKAGQLDQAIEALKRGAAENPASAEYPAALGQAQLQKCGVLAQNGAAINEMGILGMQADQSLDQALKLDPANWEAQFFKAAAMSHWPLELNKGDEVIQRFSGLIDQQDRMSPEPQFAQTYVLLGDQYQKMGKPDYAAATWQLGARKFPGDRALQQKTRGN